MKQYTIHTKLKTLTLYSMEQPYFTGDLIEFTKVSGNIITFIKRNVIAVDCTDAPQGNKKADTE